MAPANGDAPSLAPVTSSWDVRTAIGRTLAGDVLEIGPGHVPFPVGDGARMTYADRSIDGGRDANFPELVGEPHGPDAHVDLDLDRDGLRAFADGSFDGVVASHMIEHLANPVAALVEFWRVLRPGGRLVLLVPDRDHTFDAGRAPTPLAHVLDEHRRGVTSVDEAHIREFCAALYAGPVIHPPEVRDWHDPERLDDERLELHRRRSIHVHCWSPEEFATLIVGIVAAGLGAWALRDVYLRDDLDEDGIEFGLVLERPSTAADDAVTQAAAVAAAWATAVASDPGRDPRAWRGSPQPPAAIWRAGSTRPRSPCVGRSWRRWRTRSPACGPTSPRRRRSPGQPVSAPGRPRRGPPRPRLGPRPPRRRMLRCGRAARSAWRARCRPSHRPGGGPSVAGTARPPDPPRSCWLRGQS